MHESTRYATRFPDGQLDWIATTLELDFDQERFNRDDLRRGMMVELEHGSIDAITDVTHDDPLTTAKIALAHLREFHDYYDRLEGMERQAHEEAAGPVVYPI